MSIFKRLREFKEGEDAKADDIEIEFDNVAATLKGGITADNIANGSITAAKLGANVVGKGQLAGGYTAKETSGTAFPQVFSSYQSGPEINIAHGLGEVPSFFGYSIQSAVNFVIVLEFRVTNIDAGNVRGQIVAGSPMPGGVGESTFTFPIYWNAKGQP